MRRLPARSWLLKRDLRWWEVSCWLISLQPWTPLWASGPSRLLTELCAKDKTFLCCVQCDQVSLFFCCSQQYHFSINWLDAFPDLWTSVSNQMEELQLTNNSVESRFSFFCFGWSGFKPNDFEESPHISIVFNGNRNTSHINPHSIFSIQYLRRILSLYNRAVMNHGDPCVIKMSLVMTTFIRFNHRSKKKHHIPTVCWRLFQFWHIGLN